MPWNQIPLIIWHQQVPKTVLCHVNCVTKTINFWIKNYTNRLKLGLIRMPNSVINYHKPYLIQLIPSCWQSFGQFALPNGTVFIVTFHSLQSKCIKREWEDSQFVEVWHRAEIVNKNALFNNAALFINRRFHVSMLDEK